MVAALMMLVSGVGLTAMSFAGRAHAETMRGH
jgi:hypothetical protein